jgi:hypothetical protein
MVRAPVQLGMYVSWARPWPVVVQLSTHESQQNQFFFGKTTHVSQQMHVSFFSLDDIVSYTYI